MARLFDDGSSDYLTKQAAIVTAAPFTISAWAKRDQAGADDLSIATFYDTNSTDGWLLYMSPGNLYFLVQTGAGISQANAGVTTINTWHHCAAIEVANNDRWAILDNNKVQSTGNRTPANVDNVSIGARSRNSAPDLYFSGSICEVGVWDVALNDNEIAALAAGTLPKKIRPASLIGYWPLWGDHSPEIDLTSSGNSLTVAGATKANHAPVQMVYTPVYHPLSTEYNQSAAGVLTPAGILIRQTGKGLVGSITPTGALVRQTRKIVAGVLTPTGTLAKLTSKITFAGSIAPSGSLASTKTVLKTVAGVIAPTGALVRQTGKGLVGSITPTGALSKIGTFARTVVGVITPTGALIKTTVKITFAGILTPAGALVYQSSSAVVGIVALTLKSRTVALTLNVRDAALTLKNRLSSLTIGDR